MSVVVTGSVAVDYLMRFEGRFAELIVPEQLSRLSLSFLVEDLNVRRGGVAANITFGLAQLGADAVLVAAAGDDFADYGSWLERHGVDTRWVRTSELHHTARFHCTTDLDENQIASFYAGAMVEAREIELEPVVADVGAVELVVVSANDPAAMLRHTEQARELGIAFVADPSQQLARLSGDEIRRLVDGAEILVTNDYERELLETRSGWSAEEVLDRVGLRVTTHGGDGCVIERSDGTLLEVPVVPPRQVVDPTGVGDGFRAGLIAGRAWGLSLERSAQLGCYVATSVLETVGTQEYELASDDARQRLADAYGATAAREITDRMDQARRSTSQSTQRV